MLCVIDELRKVCCVECEDGYVSLGCSFDEFSRAAKCLSEKVGVRRTVDALEEVAREIITYFLRHCRVSFYIINEGLYGWVWEREYFPAKMLVVWPCGYMWVMRSIIIPHPTLFLYN